MTGFGAARAERQGYSVEAEARSVNHRFFAFGLRASPDLGLTEAEIEDRVRKLLQRGSVTLTVTLRRTAERAAGNIVDRDQARAVAGALRKLSKELKLAGKVTLEQVIRAPGVFVSKSNGDAQSPVVKQLTRQAVDGALAQMLESRAREGRALVAELRSRVARMRECGRAVEARAPKAVAEAFERLRARAAELLKGTRGDVSPQDLTRELALLAERTDVAEELTRLRTHLDELDSLLGRPEPVGRRVDFLVQELLREVNTTGSKSADAEITRYVVEMKAEIERIREQAANLE
jgi:uncharacterized protein (TIGR00255 family)